MRDLISPDGSRIRGSIEIIPGVALIAGASRAEDGSLVLHYQGGTDVHWDGQKTELKDGERLFIDDDGQTWKESELRLAPEVDTDE